MTQKQEIEILQSLKGDTYFAQCFSEKDIDQMCQNIANDFAIEKDCDFCDKWLETARSLKCEMNAEKETTVRKIIEYANPSCNDELYHYCESLCGQMYIIETKRRIGMSLFDEEVDFLIKMAKQRQSR